MDVVATFPTRPPVPMPLHRTLRRTGIDVPAFFASYPLRAKLQRVDVYHLTDQMLATLLLFQRFPRPVVVTVMDIIPYLVQHVRELNTFRHRIDYWFYRLAMRGLRRADALIAISDYTRQTLIEILGLAPERIHVVQPAVDHTRFRPVPVTPDFLARYGLDPDTPYLLFVGSEDPRKNLDTLIRVVDRVRHDHPAVQLLKIGESQFVDERRRLLALSDKLEMIEHVRFLDFVRDEDLPYFYSLAKACVVPSLYEGFGLPIAEAMACGTPVVYARSGPMPEVAGGCGVEVDPRDVDSFAGRLSALLADPTERARLSEAGRERAQHFMWRRAAIETRAVYADLMRVERRNRDA
jgi:glycosyltransferase involved in cell wall biosynthesis